MASGWKCIQVVFMWIWFNISQPKPGECTKNSTHHAFCLSLGWRYRCFGPICTNKSYVYMCIYICVYKHTVILHCKYKTIGYTNTYTPDGDRGRYMCCICIYIYIYIYIYLYVLPQPFGLGSAWGVFIWRLAPGIPVGAICQVHRVSDSLVKVAELRASARWQHHGYQFGISTIFHRKSFWETWLSRRSSSYIMLFGHPSCSCCSAGSRSGLFSTAGVGSKWVAGKCSMFPCFPRSRPLFPKGQPDQFYSTLSLPSNITPSTTHLEDIEDTSSSSPSCHTCTCAKSICIIMLLDRRMFSPLRTENRWPTPRSTQILCWVSTPYLVSQTTVLAVIWILDRWVAG